MGGVLPDQTSIGPPDAYIRKYERDGNHIWTRQFGTELLESASGLAVDTSGIYAVGVTDGIFPGQTDTQPPDAFLAKYDRDGNPLSIHNIGTGGVEWALDVDVNLAGIYAVGWTTGVFPGQTANGDMDAFLLRAPLESAPADPAVALQQLVDDIDNLNLPKGTSASLNAPLKQAVMLLTDDNTTNDNGVCGKLHAFTNRMKAAEKSDKLDAEEVSDLRDLVNSLQSSLGC